MKTKNAIPSQSIRDSIVVYTAITGDYDDLQPPPEQWKKEVSFIAYVDRAHASAVWEQKPLEHRFSDPCRNAKIYKILPHHFMHCDYSIWVDGSVRIKSEMQVSTLIRGWLNSADIAVFRHRRRKCIYAEAKACTLARKDDIGVMSRQVRRYRTEGYPENAGLHECTVLVRRHTPEIAAFDEAWHEEIRQASRRDQLSFDYLVRKFRLRVADLPGSIETNDHFQWLPHNSTPPLLVKKNAQLLQRG